MHRNSAKAHVVEERGLTAAAIHAALPVTLRGRGPEARLTFLGQVGSALPFLQSFQQFALPEQEDASIPTGC
jgi:hypothetical protein